MEWILGQRSKFSSSYVEGVPGHGPGCSVCLYWLFSRISCDRGQETAMIFRWCSHDGGNVEQSLIILKLLRNNLLFIGKKRNGKIFFRQEWLNIESTHGTLSNKTEYDSNILTKFELHFLFYQCVNICVMKNYKILNTKQLLNKRSETKTEECYNFQLDTCKVEIVIWGKNIY